MGPVLRAALTADGTLTLREEAALRRAGLWDRHHRMPSDRSYGICRGGVEGLDRGYAMHECLDTHAVHDAVAVERYEAGIRRYFRVQTRDILSPDVQDVLDAWPVDLRRPFVGRFGGVPLDAVLIALVASGFAPPRSFGAALHFADGFRQDGGGSAVDWPLLHCPSPRSPVP